MRIHSINKWNVIEFKTEDWRMKMWDCSLNEWPNGTEKYLLVCCCCILIWKTGKCIICFYYNDIKVILNMNNEWMKNNNELNRNLQRNCSTQTTRWQQKIIRKSVCLMTSGWTQREVLNKCNYVWCKNSDEGDASTDLPQSPLRETKTYSQDGKSAHPFHILHVLLR